MINRKIQRLVIVWMAVLSGFSINLAYSQSIKTSIDRQDILIGEPINYKLLFTFPTSDYQIEFNVPDSIEHFEILDKIKSDSTDKKGNYLVFQNIRFTSWDSGRWAIPSFAVKIRNAATNSRYTLNTDQLLINVGYAPADSTGELRDIKPVMDVFYIDNSWIYIAAAVLTAIILLVILYRYFKRRPKREKPIFDSKLTPYEEAMASLKNLEGANLWDAAVLKGYYTSISDILKKYYSRTQGKNLLNKTTAEMLLLFKEKEMPAEAIGMLAETLRRGDAVKFAKYNPPQTENEQSLQQVRSVITYLNKNEKQSSSN